MMNRFLFLTFVSAFVLFTFVKLWPYKQDANLFQVSPTQISVDVIAEVNSLRASKKLPLYQANAILMSIAQSHADYMAATGVITHFSVSGSRPYQRAISAGYLVAGDLSIGGLFLENIQAGSNLSPAGVVAIWQTDAEHLNTMISPDLKDIGIGVAHADGLTFYVLDAGASTGEPSITQTAGLDVINSATPGTQSAPVVVSTLLKNGDVYHEVQLDETLWSIANAYNTSIEQIKLLNNLTTDEISAGQKLLIKQLIPATLTFTPVVAVTFGIPTSTATLPVTPTVTSTSTPLPTPPASLKNGGMMLVLIVLIALVASGLGSWLSRER